MPRIQRPLSQRLDQLLALVHAAAEAAPTPQGGNLFIHRDEHRLWLSRSQGSIGQLTFSGDPRFSREHGILDACGPRMLWLMRVLHAHWPLTGDLFLSPDQAVWVGPDGLRAVRRAGGLRLREPLPGNTVLTWKPTSQDMEPGQVALSGTFHQRLEGLQRVRAWTGVPWTLSHVEVPTFSWRPHPLFLFRFDRQAVLCKDGPLHPQFQQAWRL